ncbi:MAG: branched-chain amino acid ABC transporter permease [Ectothiorhodospiraceae bacterium]|nr:branched-chain amino acid ABC transporter permease [Ectothiorhodospiraceae bacterium]
MMRIALFVALVILAIIAPFFVYPVFLMKVFVFALFASAFNLLLGYAGLLSFGHAAFFGTGSYITAHALKVWGFPFEMGLLAGVVASTALGVLFGLIAVRRLGIYFAMITLALAQMMYFVYLQAPFTGGEDGIQSVPRGTLLGLVDLRSDLNLYYVVLAISLAGIFCIYRIVKSPFGQVLRSIGQNPDRSVSLGYSISTYKLAVYIMSAAFSGLAGALLVVVFQLASLDEVNWHMSGEVVLMTLVGGVGTLLGPIVGAAVIVTLQNYLAEVGQWVLVIQGSIFVIIVLAFRKGIVGELSDPESWLRTTLRRVGMRSPGPGPSARPGEAVDLGQARQPVRSGD